MTQSRRDFLKTTAAAGGALGLGLLGCVPSQEGSGAPMRILILGGTGFIGPHQVRAALAAGHTVSIFNRGRTNPDLFGPEVEQLVGDRDGGLASLQGRRWDVVIDNSGYVPRHVRDSAQLLKDHTEHYLFISTLSVYADFSQQGISETSPVGTLDDPTVEQVTGETYGPLKALCEQEVQAAFGADRCTIVRPGLIVGPGDTTDRWTYWPVRVDRGGEVLAPGTPGDRVLIIDARDLADFALRMVSQRTPGVFNAVGPAGDLTMGSMLEQIRAAVGSGAAFTFVDAAFLAEQNVTPWMDMPAWFPSTGEMAGFGSFDRSKAVAAGLTFRPVGVTASDTLAWHRTRPAEEQAAVYPDRHPESGRRPGLSVEREQAVLAAWKARQS